VEEGSHEALYNKGGAYYELYTQEIEKEARAVGAFNMLDGD
jgi:hypothetical protein